MKIQTKGKYLQRWIDTDVESVIKHQMYNPGCDDHRGQIEALEHSIYNVINFLAKSLTFCVASEKLTLEQALHLVNCFDEVRLPPISGFTIGSGKGET
jgi:hypothetical protein